ncbi:unnamed protein product, partial [Didymodactylos carnosus]
RFAEAWLITNGFNIGIVQLVGHAISKSRLTSVDKKKITAIGMAKYGCIKDFEKLKKPKHDENQPNNAHNVPSRGGEEVQPRQRGEQDLEMNHTHYILLDDGTLRQYDTEDYRTRLVQEIANDISIVPTVTIVVGGGRDTIKNMYYDLRRNIPVIIIDVCITYY